MGWVTLNKQAADWGNVLTLSMLRNDPTSCSKSNMASTSNGTALTLSLSLSLYKLICTWLRNSPAFYGTQCSLPPSQKPAIKHYPKHKSEVRVVFRKNILCCEKYSGLSFVDHQYLKAISQHQGAVVTSDQLNIRGNLRSIYWIEVR